MKKFVFIVAIVFALIVVLCAPCFAAETSVDRGDPVDWFGGESGPYTCTTSSFTDLKSFLISNGYNYSNRLTCTGSGFVADSGSLSFTAMYADSVTNQIVLITGPNSDWSIQSTSTFEVTFSVNDLSGLDVGNLTFTGTSSGGFVDSGVSVALSQLSTIVSAILSNQYILIAIGLAVGVPLVAWGISKIKSLVKGY